LAPRVADVVEGDVSDDEIVSDEPKQPEVIGKGKTDDDNEEDQ
jgi:hypothetical protein